MMLGIFEFINRIVRSNNGNFTGDKQRLIIR